MPVSMLTRDRERERERERESERERERAREREREFIRRTAGGYRMTGGQGLHGHMTGSNERDARVYAHGGLSIKHVLERLHLNNKNSKTKNWHERANVTKVTTRPRSLLSFDYQ
jgi:hypothetical protein